jgi:hypothetical protein
VSLSAEDTEKTHDDSPDAPSQTHPPSSIAPDGRTLKRSIMDDDLDAFDYDRLDPKNSWQDSIDWWKKAKAAGSMYTPMLIPGSMEKSQCNRP